MVEVRVKLLAFMLAVLVLVGCGRESETCQTASEIPSEAQAAELADIAAAENLADGQANGQTNGTSETDLERDTEAALAAAPEKVRVENIRRWFGSRERDCIWGKPLDRRLAEPEEEVYEEEQINALAAEELKEQGFYGQKPTGVLRGEDADCWQLECYLDEERQKICLLMRFYERGSGVLESVCCAVRDFDEAGAPCGTVLVSYDEKQDVTSERYYDSMGRKCGEAVYLCREDTPFRFVTEKRDLEYFPWLNRTTAFLEEYCEFDDRGRFRGTRKIEDSDGVFHPYLSGACDCIYGDDGKLTEMDEERSEDAEQGELWTAKNGWTEQLSGQFTLHYDDSGTIRTVDYQRAPSLYGTWKSAGEIVYDMQGRICYDSYFSTYGCSPDIDMYLYREGEERPFLYVSWSAYSADGFADIVLFEGTAPIPEIGCDYNTSATQEDIIHIGQLSHLKQLQISVNDKEIDLSPLGNLSELESLEINMSCLCSPDLSFLQNLTKLEKMRVTVGWEADLSPIGSLTGLKQLTLYSYGDAPRDLSFLKNLKGLTEVFMDKWCDIEDLSYFQDMPHLQSLSLSYVGDVDLCYLSELENLETLQITGAHIRNLDGLGNLVNLKHLSLSDNSTDAMYGETEPLNLQPLANLTRLEWLDLEYIHLNDITPLASLKGLRHIGLTNTKVEDILPLSDLENLDERYVFGNYSEMAKEQVNGSINDLGLQ